MTQDVTQQRSAKLYRRGDASPVDAGLVFLRYKRGKEVWVTPDKFEKSKSQARVVGAKHRAKPEHKVKMKKYFRDYNRRPQSVAYRSEYWRRPEIQQRRRDNWANDPKMKEKSREASRSPKSKAARQLYRARNKEAIRDYMREYRRICMATKPEFRIAHNCRSRMRDAVQCQGTRKASKAKDLLGCEFEFFRGWLEAKFERGMSWLNYGVFWEIDHIRPVASFDLNDPEQQRACFHYTNCQPLWSDLNRSKGSKHIINCQS